MKEEKQLEMFEDEQDTANNQKEKNVSKTPKEKHEEKTSKKEKTITTKRGETFTLEEWESPAIAGGPLRKEIEEWKDKYGHVYFTPFEGEIYVWRTLGRKEYRAVIQEDQNMMDREETVTEKCVLFPRNFKISDFEKGRAGIPSLLTEMIMEKSGFVAQSAPIKL